MNSLSHIVDYQHQLARQISHWTGDQNQFDTPIPGVRLSRWTEPTPPASYTHNPSICLIAQGRKRVLLGEDAYVYDANHFLISSVGLPITAWNRGVVLILIASPMRDLAS